MNRTPVFEARNISISFSQYEGALRRIDQQVIHDLSATIYEGEVVAIVGASGSGKSLLAHAILGILPRNASLGGQMYYRTEPLTQSRIEQLRGREIALVPQNVSYLDPLMKVGAQVRNGASGKQARRESARALGRYGLGAEVDGLYPFELSGGMARRVLISTAAMGKPKLVIADEPTPGLHMDAAKRVLGHFREIADEGAAVLLITHDLELAMDVADRVVVFYAGTTIEEALGSDFADPAKLRHPYTRALVAAMPRNGFHAPPCAAGQGGGCPLRASCSMADDECAAPIPYRPLRNGYVRCIKEADHGIDG